MSFDLTETLRVSRGPLRIYRPHFENSYSIPSPYQEGETYVSFPYTNLHYGCCLERASSSQPLQF